MKSHFTLMADYNAWANQRLYRMGSQLPDDQYRRDVGAYFKSLHGTLNHLPMNRWIAILVLAAMGLASCDARDRGTPTSEESRRVTMRDFFAYSCVREYIKTHSLPEFDSSVAYGVEYSRVSDDVLTRVYGAAKEFAATLRAPNLADAEHGGVAVVALCLEKSRDPALTSIVAERDL